MSPLAPAAVHLVRAADAVAYQPPNHTWVGAHRLQGLEAGGPTRCAVAISEYPPGATADPSTTPVDTVYVVLAGRLTLSVDGADIVLDQHDSVFLPVGTMRSMRNDGAAQASLLVVVTPNP